MLTNEQKIKVIYYILKNRIAHPDGTFDKAGRWYPNHYCSCCSKIRSPTRSYPYSYIVHCRTIKHIKTAFNENPNIYTDSLGSLIKFFDMEEIPLLINDAHSQWANSIMRNVLENKYDWIK